MRSPAFRAWLVASALLLTQSAQPAFAGGQSGNSYERATQLHHDERWEEAAAGFIASYQAGYREETSAYNAACALARGGHREDALQWLEVAYQAGFDLTPYLDDDDDLDSLRGDPRFAAFRTKALDGRRTPRDREGDRLVQRYDELRGQLDARPEKLYDLGRELLGAGRYDEATRAFLTSAARKDDPSSSLYNAACSRSLQGQTAAALELLQKAVEEGFADPSHLDRDDDLDALREQPRYREIRALAAELEVPPYPADAASRNGSARRQWTAALPRIEAAVRRYPQLGQVWFNLGFARIALGQADHGVAAFTRSVELGYHKGTSLYNLACAHALAGHADEAFDWLDRAIANGFESWSLIKTDGDLDSLRRDPRFRHLLDLARASQQR